jgi:hypothetical protein
MYSLLVLYIRIMFIFYHIKLGYPIESIPILYHHFVESKYMTSD